MTTATLTIAQSLWDEDSSPLASQLTYDFPALIAASSVGTVMVADQNDNAHLFQYVTTNTVNPYSPYSYLEPDFIPFSNLIERPHARYIFNTIFPNIVDVQLSESISPADIRLGKLNLGLYVAQYDTTGSITGHARIEGVAETPALRHDGKSDIYLALFSSEYLGNERHIRNVITHEIGHVFGLTDIDTYPGSMPISERSQKYTIMSYEVHPGENAPQADPIAVEFQIYDIAALQKAYGWTPVLGANTYGEFEYEAYVAGGAYRDHLGLTAPLLVLNVLSDEQRAKRMVDFVAQRYPHGNAFMLFQAWPDFGPVFRPPEPSQALLNGGWLRGGLEGFRTDRI